MSGEPQARRPASQDPDLDPSGPEALRDGSLSGAVVSFSSKQIERVRDLLGRMYGVRRSLRFYPTGHPAVEDGIDGLMAVIAEYHAEGVDVPLTFFEDELLLGEQMLPEDSVLFDQLIRDMTSIGAGSVTFERGLSPRELLRAMQALAVDAAQAEDAGGLNEIVSEARLDHVTIGAVEVLDRPPEGEASEESRAAHGSALDLLRDLEMALRTRSPFPAAKAKTVVRSLVENILANRFAMLELAGLKDYDEYTFYHSVNVAILSLALGSAISEDRRFLNSLGAGALMHDVGKMTVEGSILNKPGALSAEEWAKMRLHPVHGAELVATMPGMDKAAVVVILEHHMRHDGRGYPATRTEKRQHLASRIVAVADAFDAMTSKRSYSAARLPDDAMGVLVENLGTAFDPALVPVFVRMMGVYPPRSFVRLTSGEIGVVVEPAQGDLSRPVVRVFSDAEGTMIDSVDVDLADPSDSDGRSVEACLDPRGLNVDADDYV